MRVSRYLTLGYCIKFNISLPSSVTTRWMIRMAEQDGPGYAERMFPAR